MIQALCCFLLCTIFGQKLPRSEDLFPCVTVLILSRLTLSFRKWTPSIKAIYFSKVLIYSLLFHSFVLLGKCFSDPGKCKHKGMTFMAQIKLIKKGIHQSFSSYILSSGGQTTKARGFAFLKLAKKYILILSTKNKQWKMETNDVPDGWFNLAFTWENDGILKLYINGKSVGTAKPISVSRPQDSFTYLEICRPNNSLRSKYRMPLQMRNLALWERALPFPEVRRIVESGESFNSFATVHILTFSLDKCWLQSLRFLFCQLMLE